MRRVTTLRSKQYGEHGKAGKYSGLLWPGKKILRFKFGQVGRYLGSLWPGKKILGFKFGQVGKY